MAENRRFLGDLDAANDQHFENHFVESVYLRRILTNNSDVIYGSKGVGKTALRRALTEINSDHFFATKTIDLDQISFRMVHAQLSKITETTQTEIPRFAQNIWRNILTIYCLESVAEALPHDSGLRKKINQLLHKEGFAQADSNSRLLNLIEKIMDRLASLGTESDLDTPLGLPRRHYDMISKFPSIAEVADLLIECSQGIKNSDKYVLICLDGLDSIQDHTREARKGIFFAGLIDAIHKSSKDNLLSHSFCFKAFLPQELASDARSIIWDADKFIQNTHYLRWSNEDFQNLLIKRLQIHSKVKGNNFSIIWNEFMPDKIRNDIHRKDENTYNYILRHTLFRPRQILTHLQNILDKWDEISNSFKVDPSFIPGVVANTNHELAGLVVNQLELQHPGLSSFMQSWNGLPNTMKVNDFQQRIKKYLLNAYSEELHTVFDDMYNYGIFGIASKTGLTKGSEQTEFQFGFVRDKHRNNLHASVDSDSILAISPMFHEYCGCVPSEYGIVVPAI